MSGEESNQLESTFVHNLIRQDFPSKIPTITTRFPPEPNGYLHLGHAKSIFLNFGLPEYFQTGQCYLRFDDTNPVAEESHYSEAIKKDVEWLLQTKLSPEHIKYTSDYFEILYRWALYLIDQDLAYVCDLSLKELTTHRGWSTKKLSPKSATHSSSTSQNPKDPRLFPADQPCAARLHRTPAESRKLFEEMNQGKYAPGSKTLRAKIDLASPNPNLRDPILYRISDCPHHRTGTKWHVYPTYDWAHGQSDALEGITHSICTLEFENHRVLYDWFLRKLEPLIREQLTYKFLQLPRQIEFARLNLSQTVMSKRKLKELIDQQLVSGWDDPRLPTLRALRRRGFTPSSLRHFCQAVGVAKNQNLIELSQLESSVRQEFERTTLRRLVVLDPIKVIVENYADDQEDWLPAPNHPTDESFGKRKIPFSRHLWLERADFMINPPKKYFRLYPGNEVRLRYAYLATCTGYQTDPQTGQVTEVTIKIDPASRGGNSPDGRKVKGTLGWVSARHSVPVETRLYEPVYQENEATGELEFNPNSQTCLTQAQAEPAVMDTEEVEASAYYQFERQGYFHRDPEISNLFHRTVTLKDTWKKISQLGKKGKKSK